MLPALHGLYGPNSGQSRPVLLFCRPFRSGNARGPSPTARSGTKGSASANRRLSGRESSRRRAHILIYNIRLRSPTTSSPPAPKPLIRVLCLPTRCMKMLLYSRQNLYMPESDPATLPKVSTPHDPSSTRPSQLLPARNRPPDRGPRARHPDAKRRDHTLYRTSARRRGSTHRVRL